MAVATRRPVLSAASAWRAGASLLATRGVGEESRFIPPVERLCRRAGNYGGASGSFTDFTASTAMEHPGRPQSLRA